MTAEDADFYAGLAQDVLSKRLARLGHLPIDLFERDRCASDAACYALAAAGLIDFEELENRMFNQEQALMTRHNVRP